MTLKGQTILHARLSEAGLSDTQISAILPILRDWIINDIIQRDENTTMTGVPYDDINKLYEVISFYKDQMRERVKNQTKESTHVG